MRPYCSYNGSHVCLKCNQLAQSPDPVVGVRWGKPGRLVPPMHNGQEMLFLSTSSCLHAVSIPADTMNRFCGLEVGNVGDSPHSLPPVRHLLPQVKSDLKSTNTQKLLEAPKYCLSGLKRYVVPSDPSPFISSDHQSPLRNKAIDHTGGRKELSVAEEYWGTLQEAVLLLQKKVQSGCLEGLSIGLVDKYARQVPLYYCSIFFLIRTILDHPAP